MVFFKQEILGESDKNNQYMDKTLDELIVIAKENLSKKKFDDALVNLKQIIEKKPDHLAALSTIGDILVFKKNFFEAIKTFDKILSIDAQLPLIHNNKGFCLLRSNQLAEAINCFKKAIEYKKDYSDAYNNCGTALKMFGESQSAKKYFLDAIKYNNKNFQALLNLGSLYLEFNDLENAYKYLNDSIKINSKSIEAFNNLGITYKKDGKLNLSIESFQTALKLNPKYIPSLINIAKINSDLKQYDESYKYFEKSLQIEPENINALSSLIYLKSKLCDFDKLNMLKEKLFNICNLDDSKTMQPYYALLLFDNIKFQKKIANKWSKKYPKNSVFDLKNYENKKINIGYFSSDFKNHAVSSLLEDIFKNHNKEKFQLIGLNINIEKLEENSIKTYFDKFVECGSKTDHDIIDICNQLKIDIAIDLNGHTNNNRFQIFKNRCAPIQINYLGYAGTCGEEVFDYIIADKIVIPEKFLSDYYEKIIFMPDTFFPNSLSNKKINSNLKRLDFNLPEEKFVFCCFNNLVKFNENIFNNWSQILKSSRNSVLWLSASKNSAQIENILSEFKKRDISENRLFFSEKVSYSDYLQRFTLADLFLDTFPYGGHTTSIEALSSGLPVLTITGESFQNRVSASLLTGLNLKELITTNNDDYVNLAVELSQDQKKIKQLRQKIIDQKNKSNVFNSIIYTKKLENAYVKIYEKLITGQKFNNIYLD